MGLATWTMNQHLAVGRRSASSPNCRRSRSSPCFFSCFKCLITGRSKCWRSANSLRNDFKSPLGLMQIPTHKRKLPSFPSSLPIPVTRKRLSKTVPPAGCPAHYMLPSLLPVPSEPIFSETDLCCLVDNISKGKPRLALYNG